MSCLPFGTRILIRDIQVGLVQPTNYHFHHTRRGREINNNLVKGQTGRLWNVT